MKHANQPVILRPAHIDVSCDGVEAVALPGAETINELNEKRAIRADQADSNRSRNQLEYIHFGGG